MKLREQLSVWATAAALTTLVSGCGNGSTDDTKTVTVSGDAPIAYAKRSSSINANPTNAAPTAPGGDILLREKSSASATEHNVTAAITQGTGDASNPDVSYDGKKLIFSLRCPTTNTSTVNGQRACTGRWNIWEYDMSAGNLTAGTLRRLTSSTTADDVDPTYLPAGRGFVFTSNRQTRSSINQALGQTYFALDEYERERVFNLHTMDVNGQAITQISVNQSHDRSPSIRPNGDIMFSRWDHVGGRNHFKIFKAKPDGTDLFVLYGAHSPGNSFLHPRDMDPKGKYKGFLTSDLMPLSNTDEGGGLVMIDAANYSEQDTPANTSAPARGGQKQMTLQELNIDGGASLHGRVTTPYPLWDGTDRVLVGFSPCQVTRKGVVVSCATLTPEELARVGDQNRAMAEANADEVQNNVRPTYAIYMFDPAKQTFLIVAAPPPGFMYTHPVALQARAEPNVTPATTLDTTLAAQNLGLLEVRSVYDTDGLGRMGDPVLTAIDLPAGCTTAIPKTAPTDPLDTRARVADILRMKDPADAAYGCAPARFIRAVRAIAPGEGMTGTRNALGETEFEMQQILGYAPIEPDGSFKLQVPADTPIALAVIDTQGRAFQTHTNWIQVRPGERRTCDGCHSPRRGGALNAGAIVNSQSTALLPAMASAHQSGETMASTRTRLDPNALKLAPDMVSTDVWADTSKPGVTARTALTIRYTGNAQASDDLATTVPVNGIVNYPEHIQPLWSRNRGAGTCTGCHSDPTRLDLTATRAASGRISSYDELMIGDPVIDPATGQPVTRVQEGVVTVERGPALVDTAASEGEALGLARKSRLIEILSGQTLMAGTAARTAHPAPPATAPNHANLLNKAEKRLVAEWIDLGSKYYNDPFDAGAAMVQAKGMGQAAFESQVLPVLRATCAAGCHQPVGSSAQAKPQGTSFRNNRFVLTGDAAGDYNATLAMVSNTCNAASNSLLKRPSSAPHPVVLPVGSTNYNKISSWITTGC
ncbi:MAG: hypothetical protein V4627_02540 [Pseudomonadota bacterium]